MNYKSLVKNATKATDTKAIQAADNRSAITSTALSVGDVIAFPDDEPANFSQVVNVAGNAVRMIYGVKLTDKAATFDENGEGMQISALAFGRKVRNPATKETISPKTLVAQLPAAEFDPTKQTLAFDEIGEKTVGEIPAYCRNKKFVVVAMQDVARVNADGTPRLNADSSPMFTPVYAFERL